MLTEPPHFRNVFQRISSPLAAQMTLKLDPHLRQQVVLVPIEVPDDLLDLSRPCTDRRVKEPTPH